MPPLLNTNWFPALLFVITSYSIHYTKLYEDTVGTLIGLSARADLLDEKGNLPDIEKPMLADALSTVVAPLLGTTTTGAYRITSYNVCYTKLLRSWSR